MLNREQKQENSEYTLNMISMLNEGGIYIWKDERETFTMKNGSLIGKKHAVNKLKRITLPYIHNRLIVK
jgi:hypothetical protein